MFEKIKNLKHAAILQVIAAEISGDEPVSLTASRHAGALFHIAADLIVESAPSHITGD